MLIINHMLKYLSVNLKEKNQSYSLHSLSAVISIREVQFSVDGCTHFIFASSSLSLAVVFLVFMYLHMCFE